LTTAMYRPRASPARPAGARHVVGVVAVAAGAAVGVVLGASEWMPLFAVKATTIATIEMTRAAIQSDRRDVPDRDVSVLTRI
jgi:hypothetical protein